MRWIAVARSLCVALVAIAAPAGAQTWRVQAEKDAITDFQRRIATTANSEGHSLSVYRIEDGSAWATLRLAERSFDQFATDRAPILRVDQNNPNDLDDVRRLAAELPSMIEIKPKWVSFKVWHGKSSEGFSATLREWMGGKVLTVRYYLFTGGYKDTRFQLTGADRAIRAALDVDAGAVQAGDAARDARRAAHREAMDACTARGGSEMPLCHLRVIRCLKPDVTLDALKACNQEALAQ